MKSAIAYAALATIATAQIQILQFGSNELPSCAQTCQTLLNAQTVCIPPAAPVTNVQTYKSCFCQSGYLNTLSTDASTICDTTCTSQSDRNQIQSWYSSYCANANDLPSGTAAAATSAAVTTTAANGATTTVAGPSNVVTATGSATVSSTPGISTEDDRSWWSTHARWIAMVIVLVIGFALLTVLLLWIRRRYRQKHYGVGQEAPPVVWGPHQNQHYTGGTMYPGAEAAGPVAAERYNEKGKGTATISPQMAQQQQQQYRQSPNAGRLQRNNMQEEKTGTFQRFRNHIS